eukprot:CAMPEP_0202103726 /NCGR_PEP_ID=MMETSP0965-20130614/5061_1 /ASSEMBLY_ACC=CAM_ASM_000507 /TAXON_ID=4773 /ORGANISM="Schizochytrium aggregatum, Strain ATCC28209" /LENGTH=100 /DNA_ID=CAMNT_0048672543 /DNA_START=1 /DNA_END=303 /DNA_ORIENTATION=+
MVCVRRRETLTPSTSPTRALSPSAVSQPPVAAPPSGSEQDKILGFDALKVKAGLVTLGLGLFGAGLFFLIRGPLRRDRSDSQSVSTHHLSIHSGEEAEEI